MKVPSLSMAPGYQSPKERERGRGRGRGRERERERGRGREGGGEKEREGERGRKRPSPGPLTYGAQETKSRKHPKLSFQFSCVVLYFISVMVTI